jgi:hypothetical protein
MPWTKRTRPGTPATATTRASAANRRSRRRPRRVHSAFPPEDGEDAGQLTRDCRACARPVDIVASPDRTRRRGSSKATPSAQAAVQLPQLAQGERGRREAPGPAGLPRLRFPHRRAAWATSPPGRALPPGVMRAGCWTQPNPALRTVSANRAGPKRRLTAGVRSRTDQQAEKREPRGLPTPGVLLCASTIVAAFHGAELAQRLDELAEHLERRTEGPDANYGAVFSRVNAHLGMSATRRNRVRRYRPARH